MKEIYFDNSATTRICPEALAVYNRVSEENYGNPSSRHHRGKMAADALRAAKSELLAALGARNGRIIFTSGGTEGNNLAIFGRAYAKERYARGGKIITTAGEHASVDLPLSYLQKQGFTVAYIPTKNGELDMTALERELTKEVVLVTMMAVNNETGAVYPLRQVSDRMKRVCPDAVLHVDATQSFMKLPFTPASLGADLITVSSHKIMGPKGVGALYVSDAVVKNRGLVPLLVGGGQEDGLRSGTENLPGACAFGEAARVCRAAFAERIAHMRELGDHLLSRLSTDERLAGVTPNLPQGERAPHIISLTVKGLKSETVLNDLSGKGIYVSAGSACSSHDAHLSEALLAFGKSPDEADSTVRVSFSHLNTKDEVDALLDALAETVATRAKKRG